MKIDKSNYELFFMDYLDGKLSVEETAQVLEFLQENPELKEELEVVSEVHLTDESVVFPNKIDLFKKEEDELSIFDMRLAAYLEGDISGEEKRKLEDEIESDKNKKLSFELMQKTQLIPDSSIVFQEKEALLKKETKVIILPWIGRVAAVLILAFSVWAIYPKMEGAKTVAEVEVPVIDLKQTDQILEDIQVEQEPEQEIIIEKPTTVIQPKEILAENKQEDEIPVREAVPELLIPVTASLDSGHEMMALVLPMDDKKNVISLDEYLAMKLIDAPKGESFSLDNVLDAGLAFFEKVSNKRLKVEENEKGKISEINFNSGILAFSIPTNN